MGRDERQALIARYADGVRLLKEALAQVPAAAMQWRPGPGKWSVHEIIVHCADSETNSAMRIRYLVAEPDPVIIGYDQDRWAREFDYHGFPLDVALAQILSVRAYTVACISRLSDAAWDRVGRHTESGPFSAMDWLRTYSEHLEIHVRQIGRNLDSWMKRDG